MYDTILFDLDGTLTDSGLGITRSAMYALEQMGWPLPRREELYAFIGPPLMDTFRQRFSMTQEQAQEAVRHFRVRYAKEGALENQVYPGVEQMLRRLQEAGKRLVLATSKPEDFAVRIMAHFGLDRYVPLIAGATLDSGRMQKGQVIAYAMKEFEISAERAVMVGDRFHDVQGAAENGLGCIGVAYGYGSREELEQAGAIAVAATPEEAADIILGRE